MAFEKGIVLSIPKAGLNPLAIQTPAKPTIAMVRPMFMPRHNRITSTKTPTAAKVVRLIYSPP
jgi:hypothetical protein